MFLVIKRIWNRVIQMRSDQPPDLDEVLKNLIDRLRSSRNKRSGVGRHAPPIKTLRTLGIGFFTIILLLWLLLGIYIVNPAEKAVVLQLGRYSKTVGPGIHWVFLGLQDYYKVNEQRISSYTYEAQMLTRDANLVSVTASVQYRIGSARDYLFNVVAPDESLKQSTAAALRQAVGHNHLDAIMTSGRTQLRDEMQRVLTSILQTYHSGLEITNVIIQAARAPAPVKAAFDDAIRAHEDEKRYKNEAETYMNRIKPVAEGQAQRLLESAAAYKEQAVLKASAETQHFNALLDAHHADPGLTRERLRLENIESILSKNPKIFIDADPRQIITIPADRMMHAKSDASHGDSVGGSVSDASASAREESVPDEASERIAKILDEPAMSEEADRSDGKRRTRDYSEEGGY